MTTMITNDLRKAYCSYCGRLITHDFPADTQNGTLVFCCTEHYSKYVNCKTSKLIRRFGVKNMCEDLW